MMIAQVAAASLLNEAKVLAHPASIDNVPTSGGKGRSCFHGDDVRGQITIDRGKRGEFACDRIAGSRGSAGASTATEERAGVERAYAMVRKYAEPLLEDRALCSRYRRDRDRDPRRRIR